MIIGPESGFTPAEVDAGRASGRDAGLAGAAHPADGNRRAGADARRYFLHWSHRTLFVDIHNHILPGIDDGAPNLGHAVEMARQAVACGTDTMVATPHRAYGLRRTAPPEWVRGQVLAVQTMLDREGIPFNVVPGVEIPLGPLVADELASGQLLTLGDAGTWALIEPPFDRIPRDGLDNLRAVRDAGFDVVLAHPERCGEIQRNLNFVEACAALGCAFQLTTGSLLGPFGRTVQRDGGGHPGPRRRMAARDRLRHPRPP